MVSVGVEPGNLGASGSHHDDRIHAARAEHAATGHRAAVRLRAGTSGWRLLPKLTRKAFETFGFSTATLLTDWSTIVGDQVAGYAVPERIKWPRGAGASDDAEPEARGRSGAVLVLRVDPARALDVEYKGQQILERINAYFGYRAVAELRLLQAPITAAAKAAPAATARARRALRGPRACRYRR